MPREKLIAEYRRVISTLYDPTLKNYFARCLRLLEHMPRTHHNVRAIRKDEVRAFFQSVQKQLFSKQGFEYAKFLIKALKNHRGMFPEAVRLAVMGYHLEKITRHTVAVEDFRNFLAHEMDTFKENISKFVNAQGERMSEIHNYSRKLFTRVKAEYNAIHEDFQYAAHGALVGFSAIDVQGILSGRIRCFQSHS